MCDRKQVSAHMQVLPEMPVIARTRPGQGHSQSQGLMGAEGLTGE